MDNLMFPYNYKGVNCYQVKIEELDSHWYIARNDYGEQIFSGSATRLIGFLNDLMNNVYSE